MSNIERIIGRLEKYMEWSEAEITQLRSDVESLKHFKWKMMGGAAVVSAIAVGIAQMVQIFVGR